MKLIIREYLSSLKERGELDAILPDLLSQIGLNVYSLPGRGTRQDGVDVGAVGSLDGGPERVYLFSIKPGDLTRRGWDGDSEQSLRPSLNQIIDCYIPNRLPAEHRGKSIVICVAIGGVIQEQVRPDVTGFFARSSTDNISFEEWNGDKIAAYIQSSFLREDLLPHNARSLLRKSLAMLDEPDTSCRHFCTLIRELSDVGELADKQRITAIRQMSICLWILFAWAREAGNMDSAYRSGEVTLLHAWSVTRLNPDANNKTARAIETAFLSVFTAYNQICTEYLGANVLPYTDKLHAVSIAIHSSCSVDINLKLFDVLGRLAVDGIWAYWGASRWTEADQKKAALREAQTYMQATKDLISNNPGLLLPIKDDQAIDIFIAALLLAIDADNHDFITNWLGGMLDRARFSFEANGRYPCVLHAYGDLLEHPRSTDAAYRENATNASILYPTIAIWAALLGDNATYRKSATVKKELLQHCTYQFWYPDDRSEAHFYTNGDHHGAALADLPIDRSREDFLSQVFGECERSAQFKELSAVKFGWWPLVVIACRNYRLPLPLHVLEGLRGTEIHRDAKL